MAPVLLPVAILQLCTQSFFVLPSIISSLSKFPICVPNCIYCFSSSTGTTSSNSVCTSTCTSMSSTPKQPQGPAESSPSKSPLPLTNLQLNTSHALTSSLIKKEQLKPVEDVVCKYSKLRGECNAGRMVCKIAKEAIFGPEVMKLCTPIGSQDKPGLPVKNLQELKKLCSCIFPSSGIIPLNLKVHGRNV